MIYGGVSIEKKILRGEVCYSGILIEKKHVKGGGLLYGGVSIEKKPRQGGRSTIWCRLNRKKTT